MSEDRAKQSVYEAVGGLDMLRKLAHAWHERVLADEVVSHAFSFGYHPEHTERLAAYWAEALGGPALYDRGKVLEAVHVGRRSACAVYARASRRSANGYGGYVYAACHGQERS